MDTTTDHFTPLALRVRGNNSKIINNETKMLMWVDKNLTIKFAWNMNYADVRASTPLKKVTLKLDSIADPELLTCISHIWSSCI